MLCHNLPQYKHKLKGKQAKTNTQCFAKKLGRQIKPPFENQKTHLHLSTCLSETTDIIPGTTGTNKYNSWWRRVVGDFAKTLGALLNEFLGLEEAAQVQHLPGGESHQAAHGEEAEVQHARVGRLVCVTHLLLTSLHVGKVVDN